jgi:aminopeptidase N
MRMMLISLTCLVVTNMCLAESSAPRFVSREKDYHSNANPDQIRVSHVDLSLAVLFERKILKGEVTLRVERTSNDRHSPLILDTRRLHIDNVEASDDGQHYNAARFVLGKEDPLLGSALTIELPENVRQVRVTYATDPEAYGLQWLMPAQTAGKRLPFLYTHSEAIQARSWIPLQDSPAVRVTYSAKVRTPRDVLAVMSAVDNPQARGDGSYAFHMPWPVPPYLIALAVGDLEFRRISERTGVYAEATLVDRAAAEFADLDKMVQATEELYGPYRWGRYDVLVLPPSFPMGGMENPCLTFATPTILAGDKSLVSLVAHELAHSWSGNLVSNATWRDFWLNEGFTVYLERRILEKVYGKERAEMEKVLGRQEMLEEKATLPAKDQILHIDLRGRDPDDGFTDIPYEKGAWFLCHLENAFGRARFDGWLKQYFDHFAFQSITTGDFVGHLQKHLLAQDTAAAARVPVMEWVYQPGIPPSAPAASAAALTRVNRHAASWLAGTTKTSELPTASWCTQEWLQFLRALPATLDRRRMEELDQAFALTRAGNSEIAFQWLLMAVRSQYDAAYPRLEEFLISVGRRKFLKPLYEELEKTPDGKKRALEIYKKARRTYHPMAAATVDAVLAHDQSKK